MKKIVTIVALAATLLSAPAFAKASHNNDDQAYPATERANNGSNSNFQNQWNDGNW